MSHTDQHRFAMQVAQLSRAWRAELDRRLVGLRLDAEHLVKIRGERTREQRGE